MGCYGKSPKVKAYSSLWLFIFLLTTYSFTDLYFISNSSGETEDTFIADLSVGLATVSSYFLFLLCNSFFLGNCNWNTYQSSKVLPQIVLASMIFLIYIYIYCNFQNVFDINRFYFSRKWRNFYDKLPYLMFFFKFFDNEEEIHCFVVYSVCHF